MVLIHGFENSHEKADESYAALVSKLENEFWPGGLEQGVRVFGFHWPGDHPNRATSVASFSTRIPVASSAGEKLGRLIETLPEDHEVILVGHSLGCRVVLSCLEYLSGWAGAPGASISAVFLLAAAVPVDECIDYGSFGARHADWYVAMHSRRDRVLQIAFPPGQAAFDWASTAVGRNGEPFGPRWNARVNTGLGHGKYWTSDLVSATIAEVLAPIGTRAFRTWALPEWDARELVDEEPPAGQLPDRLLPGE